MTFSPSRIPRFAAAVAWIVIAVACGARTTIDYGDDGYAGGSNDQGGASSTSGTTTVTSGPTTTSGTTTSGTTTGGFGTGGVTTGGTTGTGSAGSSSCQDLGCPDIDCGPGFHPAMLPGACCPSCESCRNVACPAIGCPSGWHTEVEFGQCCGTCVVDKKSCGQGQKEYEQSRAQLYDKYSSQGCMFDSECVLAPENNLCVNRCGVALAKSTVGNWTSNLTSFAQSNCAACPPTGIPPCRPTVVRCVMNRCVIF